MALDGAFLAHVRRELIAQAQGARIDKIYQPARDTLVLLLRARGFSGRLLLCAGGAGPRVHFTQSAQENPAAPPMFCMLARKHFLGAKLVGIAQPGLERVLRFSFETFNELGDPVTPELVLEIMGRQSNLILVGGDGRIIDAVHRVDAETASRLILPGARYELPAPQDKLDLTARPSANVLDRLADFAGLPLSKALMQTLDGASPIVCRELSFRAARDADPPAGALDETQRQRLLLALDRLRDAMAHPAPVLVLDREGRPLDFTYFPVAQYGLSAVTKEYESCGALLDAFYAERGRGEERRRRAQDLLKLLATLTERTSRKLEKQRAELRQCGDREQLRIYGELLKANLHAIPPGASFAEVTNYYDPEGAAVRIPLDPALSAPQNAQKYFKEYRKAHTAEQRYTELIARGEEELAYLDSVFDALSRAESERELAEIREELAAGGFLHTPAGPRRAQRPLPPLRFRSDDGFEILVGRNNRQNDELTLRQGAKTDLWLHAQKIHGAHVLVLTRGKEPPDSTVEQAAMLAAYHSRARESQNVPVDCTAVKNVKKPQGAKPGMVVYDRYRTLYVTPREDLAERLKIEGSRP